MHLHTETWGHVGFPVTSALRMESAEEAAEMAMFRCRYGKRHGTPITTSLCGFMPLTDAVIFNPNTLRDLADLFQTNVEKAFA